MFSVDPTLERTFFRSGAEVLVARRLSLGAEELGFLSTAEAVEGRGGTGVALTRVGATPAGEAAEGRLVLFFTELEPVEVLLERLASAGADLVLIFLTSADFPSGLVGVGLLARAVGGLLLVGPDVARVVAVVALGTVGEPLGPTLEAEVEAGLDEEARFSGTFASAAAFGFPSLAGRVEGRAVVAAGRLGGAAGTKPEARLMGFLFDPPRVVGAGCLGREVGCVLAFDAEVFAG